MQPDPASLERLVPDALREGDATGRDTLDLHLARYRFAAREARPGRVLDLACGVGYGTRLLAAEIPGASEVVGVDCSAEAIAHANARYAASRTRFVTCDALTFSDAEGFDTVVSLETIEHVGAPDALADRLLAALRPGGVLVASVPVTPSVDVNPHHLHDFTERSFRRLFAGRGLRERAALVQVQRFRPLATLRREETRLAELRPRLGAYWLRQPGAFARRAVATLRHGFTHR